MGIPLFGGSSKETSSEKDEYQLKFETLQAEIVQARGKLQDSESRVFNLQNKLDEYIYKEHQIAEIMIMAQVNAQKTEAEARARAETILKETEEELRRKKQELEMLQKKTKQFKQEIYDQLDQYKMSLDNITNQNDNAGFTPTLVAKDKKDNHKKIGK